MVTDSEDQINKRRKEVVILLASFGGVAFIQLLLFEIVGRGIPCVFRMITGLLCPGCGMTHAFSAIFHGDLRGAMDYNLLSVTLVPVLGVFFIYRIIRYIRVGNEDYSPLELIFLVLCFIACAMFFYYRNFITI